MAYYVYYESRDIYGCDVILARYKNLELALIYILDKIIHQRWLPMLYLAEVPKSREINLQKFLSKSVKYYIEKENNKYSLFCVDNEGEKLAIPEEAALPDFYEKLERYNHLCGFSRKEIYEMYKQMGLNEKYKISKYFTSKAILIGNIFKLKN